MSPVVVTREEFQEELDKAMTKVLVAVNAVNAPDIIIEYNTGHEHDGSKIEVKGCHAMDVKGYMPIYTMAHTACTQKHPNNHSDFAYNYYGQKYAVLVQEITLQEPLDSSWATSLLFQLCYRWLKHRALACWTRKFFLYLERYYIKHDNLPGFMAVADNLFIQSFIIPSSLPLIATDIQALVGDSSDDANKLLHLASTSGILEVLKAQGTKTTDPSMSSLGPNLDLLLERAASQMTST